MSKNLFAVAIFCLHVIPLNSFAASSASSADIDSLVEGSRSEARENIRAKIVENQRLVLEISKVQDQLHAIEKDIAEHGTEAKKDLIIAGGSALGAAIISVALYKTAGSSEVGMQLNMMGAMVVSLTGASYTILNGGKAGYEYLLLKLDEKKIPDLEAQLASLKDQLEKQTEELLK